MVNFSRRTGLLAAAGVALAPKMLVATSTPTPPVPGKLESVIDALFHEHVAVGEPGAAIGLYRGGHVLFAKGYGVADLDSSTPVTPTTQFNVASVSKQFTAFAIALLASEGKIDLDAEVHRYLPWVPDFGHPITVRQLVHHTNGLRDSYTLVEVSGRDTRDVFTQRQVIELVKLQRELNFEPGTAHSYNNTGYTLLAEIVATVSGKSLRQFTTERMFAPLGMQRTFFGDDVEEIVPERATSYEKRPDERWQRTLLTTESVGHSGLVTNVTDLAQWSDNFFRPRVGDRSLLDLVCTSGTLRDGRKANYAFGLTPGEIHGRKIVSHSGGDGSFTTYFTFYPDHDLGVVVLANRALDVGGLAHTAAEVFLSGKSEKSAATNAPKAHVLKKATLERLPGMYIHPTSPSVTLERRGDTLYGWFGVEPAAAARVKADGTFSVGNWSHFRIVTGEGGAITALESIYGISMRPRLFKRVQPESVTDLSAYTGDYYSDELEAKYRFTAEGGDLVMRHIWRPDPIMLVPVTREHFNARSGWAPHVVTFERDARGDVVAARMSGARADNMRFERRTKT
jgi:CubicO group peptidase (beta-lactamase class C family)